MTDTHIPPNWIPRLIAVIGGTALELPDDRHRLLDAWAAAEGGTARWNPLNTTYGLPGATNYNKVGVKNYKRATEGVCATALTLVNGYYQGILGDLQQTNKTAEQIVTTNISEFRTWGTNPTTILQVLKT